MDSAHMHPAVPARVAHDILNIGESPWTANLPLLEGLGVAEKVRSGGAQKGALGAGRPRADDIRAAGRLLPV